MSLLVRLVVFAVLALIVGLFLVSPLHAAETFRQVVARCTAEVRREMQDPEFDAYVTEREDGSGGHPLLCVSSRTLPPQQVRRRSGVRHEPGPRRGVP